MIQPKPWATRTFSFDYPVDVFPTIVERLRGTPLRVEQILTDVPEAVLKTRVNEKWSLQERVGHLINVERLWQVRTVQFLEGAKELKAADMSNRKTFESSFNDNRLEDLISRFYEVRRMFVENLDNLSLEQAALAAHHPRLNKPMRLIDLVFFAAEHDDHELTLMRQLKTSLMP